MLVDRLEAVINGGWRPPMTDKVMIDEREALDVLDLMRTAIPEEIKQSRRVTQERERLIAEAQADANRIIDQAEERLEHMVSRETVVRLAEDRALDLEQDAADRAAEIRTGADVYATEVLQQIESRLERLMTEVRNGLEELKSPPRHDQIPAEEYDMQPAGSEQ